MTFIILAIATYRLGTLLSDTEQGGPWNLLHRLRTISGVKYDERSVPYGTNMVSNAMLCIYCNSVWIGLIAYLLYLASEPLAMLLLAPFALSGAAIMIKEIVEK
jgi:hypothetical protein